ncbi:MAG: FAD-dependent oxidoreductase [Chitinophagales bacterium]|nr:FAD-dependent oxidoreductase [Chitinophagales bacterium]
MNNSSQAIIIIGAGASGLMAASLLTNAGKEVIILEARNRIGGRIYTVPGELPSWPWECGAEFVHGSLPETLSLAKKAGLTLESVGGNTLQMQGGKLLSMDHFGAQWQLIEERLRRLKFDTTLADFIRNNFEMEKEQECIKLIQGYAEGYDAADMERASTFALRDEWLNEENGTNFRVQGGYGKLMEFLLDNCSKAGAVIHFEQVVKEIHWNEKKVSVICKNGSQWHGAQAIVAVPLGVLQQQKQESTISFFPAIPAQIKAIEGLGFGSVVKVIIDFELSFWNLQIQKTGYSEMKQLGFLLSDAPIPTWWTQYPSTPNLLTGWLAGPSAIKWNAIDGALIFEEAIASLALLFQESEDSLREKVRSYKVLNWNDDPYALGAYSYATPGSRQRLSVLNEPVKETLFFAGEHCYDGPYIGTVEAALVSGRKVAERLLMVE